MLLPRSLEYEFVKLLQRYGVTYMYDNSVFFDGQILWSVKKVKKLRKLIAVKIL